MNQYSQLSWQQKELSWQNIRKKIIKKYPQYKLIIEQNQITFSKLDYSKKENQQKLIQMIVAKQQEGLQQIFTQEQEQQKKENEKQIQKLVGILRKNALIKKPVQKPVQQATTGKKANEVQMYCPPKLQKKVSDNIEAWNHVDDTQSFIHEYEDSTQEHFYVPQDVQGLAPIEEKNKQPVEKASVEPKSILALKKGKKNQKKKVEDKKQVRFEQVNDEEQEESDSNKEVSEVEDEEQDENQEENDEESEEEEEENNEEENDEDDENEEENEEDEENEEEEEENEEEEEENEDEDNEQKEEEEEDDEAEENDEDNEEEEEEVEEQVKPPSKIQKHKKG